MTDNEKLIEEAAKAIWDADTTIPETWDNKSVVEWDRNTYRGMARAALGVFEKAHTPTDDERTRALHDAFWAVHAGRFHGSNAEHGVNTFYAGTNAAKHAIENLHGSPIIRPWSAEVPEPSADPAPRGWRSAPTESEPDRIVPQGEPSDAQVLAALNAAQEEDWRQSGYTNQPTTSTSLTDWHWLNVERMRAALRAAGVAGHVCGEPAYFASSASLYESLESPAVPEQQKDSIRAELVRRHGSGRHAQ